MRFDVVTLFPELFAPFQTIGVTRRAFETQAVDVRLWPLRDFADGTYRYSYMRTGRDHVERMKERCQYAG